MNNTFSLYEFIMESFAFPYSKDYFDILTEGYEYQLYCQYQENAIVKEYTEEYLAENGLTLDEDYFQEDYYFSEDGNAVARSSSFFSRVWSAMKKAWKYFYLGMMRIFKGQKISLDTKNPKTFRDTLNNTMWTNDLIVKMMNTEKKFDEDFWSQQPITISDKDVSGLTFARDVSSIRRQNFKKFCQYKVSDKTLRLNARSLASKSSSNNEQQQNINSAGAKSGARAASVNGIAVFFDDLCDAETLEQFNAAQEKFKKDQDDVEKNGFPVSNNPAEIEKQESLLKRINDNVQKFISGFKKDKLSTTDSDGKVDVTLANGKQKKMDPGEAKEYIKWCWAGVKELAPAAGFALAAYVGKAKLDQWMKGNIGPADKGKSKAELNPKLRKYSDAEVRENLKKVQDKLSGDRSGLSDREIKKLEQEEEMWKTELEARGRKAPEEPPEEPYVDKNIKAASSDDLAKKIDQIDQNIKSSREKFSRSTDESERDSLYESIVKQLKTRRDYYHELVDVRKESYTSKLSKFKVIDEKLSKTVLWTEFRKLKKSLKDTVDEVKNNPKDKGAKLNLAELIMLLAEYEEALKRRGEKNIPKWNVPDV